MITFDPVSFFVGLGLGICFVLLLACLGTEQP